MQMNWTDQPTKIERLTDGSIDAMFQAGIAQLQKDQEVARAKLAAQREQSLREGRF